MKWLIIAALRLSIYLGAIATIASGAVFGYFGGLNIEDFPVTGYAGAVIGAVAGILLAGLIFGTLTVLLDIRDSLVVIRNRTTPTPGETAFQDPPPRPKPAPPMHQEPATEEPTSTDEKRKEPFLGKT